MKTRIIAVCAGLSALGATGVAAAASQRPVLKSLSYATVGTGINAPGRWTAEIRLYARAPSVELEVRGIHGNESDVSVLFPETDGPGLHRFAVKNISLSAGSYAVTLQVNLPGDRHLNGANRRILVIDAAGKGHLSS